MRKITLWLLILLLTLPVLPACADSPAVGDYITFGAYEQDNDLTNGKEPIEWLVLDKKESSLMVVSRYGLDCKPYHSKNGAITWEESDLRKWLNHDFFNAAFNQSEQLMISIVSVPADKNPKYDTDPGNTTQDHLYLLSYQEVKQFFSSRQEHNYSITPYADSQRKKIYGSEYPD